MIRDIDLWTVVESLKAPADLRFINNDFVAFVGDSQECARFAEIFTFSPAEIFTFSPKRV